MAETTRFKGESRQQEAKSMHKNLDKIVVEPRRTGELMHAVSWNGKNSVEVVSIQRPTITVPTDVIVRITSTAICGSDLHLYRNEMKGMKKGDILGHEFMGYIHEIGSDVKNFKLGDRVVVAFDIADGTCWYCKKGHFSSCEMTNPSEMQEKQYGHRTSGMFGYSHLTGAYDGGQAEYARVPFADTNLLKVPSELSDEQLLFLSDVLPTGWNACEMGKVGEGDIVAVWGCGPVGLMAQALCKLRGAKQVIAIDNESYRLDLARKIGSITINFDHEKVLDRIKELSPIGVDVSIDAVGFEYSKSTQHTIQRALKLETDALDVLTECIMATRKRGRISIVGVYMALGNQFPIGAFMEKGLKMEGSQSSVQKYWKELLGYVQSGKFDPTFIITHQMPLENAAEGYNIFSNHNENCIKVVMHTPAYYELQKGATPLILTNAPTVSTSTRTTTTISTGSDNCPYCKQTDPHSH